ncbi:MAG: DUF1573 domain-containing protein [Thermodesulfobacteriota bacterium]
MAEGSATREGRGAARVALAIVALAAAWGCAATAPSQGSWGPAGGGARLVAVEEQHDFGTVESGPVVTHVFRLRNLGPETVEIRSVAGACGCTAILASSSYLAPGEEGAVEVALDTYRLSGEQAKTVVVRSTDPVRPDLTLTLHGRIETPVRAQPSRLYLGRLPAGAVVSRHVDVQLAPDVQVTAVRTDSTRFAIETAPLDAPTHGMRVRVTLLPTAQIGAFDDRIFVGTTSPRQPQLTIPVLGAIEGASLYAGAGHGGASH